MTIHNISNISKQSHIANKQLTVEHIHKPSCAWSVLRLRSAHVLPTVQAFQRAKRYNRSKRSRHSKRSECTKRSKHPKRWHWSGLVVWPPAAFRLRAATFRLRAVYVPSRCFVRSVASNSDHDHLRPTSLRVFHYLFSNVRSTVSMSICAFHCMPCHVCTQLYALHCVIRKRAFKTRALHNVHPNVCIPR